ncbi:MAG: DUF6807 family protein [Opitutaceae bacterium]
MNLESGAAISETKSAWRMLEDIPDGTVGRSLSFWYGGRPRVRLLHDSPHRKAFLHLHAADGTPLTHAGRDAAGRAFGPFPLLRGLSIGWSEVDSELGRDDFWHAEKAAETRLRSSKIIEQTGNWLVVALELAWISGHSTTDQLVIHEVRTLAMTVTDDDLRIDLHHALTARRPVDLGGDAHHGGFQFRAAVEAAAKPESVRCLWSPDAPAGDGIVRGRERQWIRLEYPAGGRRFSCLLLNHPANPLEEISWRLYGRFGCFFHRSLARGETLSLIYGVRIAAAAAAEAEAAARADAEYRHFLQTSDTRRLNK